MLRVEKQSPTWITIKGYINGRIDFLHTQLEQQLDEPATATIRGQIKELRALIAAVEPPVDELESEIGAPVY